MSSANKHYLDKCKHFSLKFQRNSCYSSNNNNNNNNNNKVKELQKTAILDTAHILRKSTNVKVQQIEHWS
jgi:hypothetical protein